MNGDIMLAGYRRALAGVCDDASLMRELRVFRRRIVVRITHGF